MATGTPKAQWNGEKLHSFTTNGFTNMPGMSLDYEGKRPEREILQTRPASIKTLWQEGAGSDDTRDLNRLYYGDNLPILASLLREPAICGKVQLIYIDPPFATNSVFQSRAQGDAYHDNPGDLVLDCFAGSGTTLAVASQLNRRWIGIDSSVEAISTTLRRFAKGLEPMGDFVRKQESVERSILKPALWESSEELTEEGEGDKVVSGNGHQVINSFSLRAIESSAGDLSTVLEQWLAWQ